MKLYKRMPSKCQGMYFGFEKEDWEGLAPLTWIHKECDRFFFPFSEIREAKVIPDIDPLMDLHGGIYFLFSGDHLEYIGQAKELHQRLRSHLYPVRPSLNKCPWLTHWSVIWSPVMLMDDIEYFYLDILRPPRNLKYLGYDRELDRYRQVVIG